MTIRSSSGRVPLLAFLLSGVLPAGSQGQAPGRIEGRITSTILDPGGQPVPGVLVRLRPDGGRVLTDGEGRFSLEAPEGRREVTAELVGCLLARRTVEVRPGEVVPLELTLASPVIQLPGIVVRAEEAGASGARASGRIEVEGPRATRSLADLIRGEFPGVRVVQGSGLPGSAGTIQLRGPTSLSGEGQPLVVVDGMIASGGFVDLNMQDVESVTILKGAAAAAEYGARGQAGVIEVVTRRGGAAAPGPMVLVDGVLTPSGLGAVDASAIRETELLVGPAAAVLLGAAGAAGGVVSVTTGATAGGGEVARCIPAEP